MKRLLNVLLIFAGVPMLSAGQSPQRPLDFSTLSHGGPFESIEQRLQRHNIPLTQVGLVRALHEGDFEVRWLAAYQLLHAYGTETIPDLVTALSVEENPLTRESIANQLAEAKDTHGVAALQTMCADATLEAYWRVKAASDLLSLQDQSCLSSVADVLREETEPHKANSSSHLMTALSLLPSFQKLSQEDSFKLAAAAAQSLQHADPLVRTAAGRALADLSDSSAIPYLQAAVAAESDLDTATELQASLDALRRKGSQ